jgi:hypothetical protein
MQMMGQEQQAQQQQQQDLLHQQDLEKIALKEGAKTERDIIKKQGIQ